MSKKALGGIGIVVLVIAGMLGYLILSGSSQKSPVSSSTPPQALPTIPEKNFAPGMPASQTTTILIQTSDSSDIKYIVPKGQVSTYVKSLPPGYHVVSKTP